MYRKIVVGYDESDPATDALALGRQLADALGAELLVAGIFLIHPIWHGGLDPGSQQEQTVFTNRLEEVATSVGGVAHPVASVSAARGLHELAEETDADLIVVGSSSHGRVGQVLAGSVGVALLHGSPCAVAIAPRGYRDRGRESIGAIAAGFDGSAEAGLALMTASALAAATGAKLRLVSVAQPPVIGAGKDGMGGWYALKDALEEQARDQLAEARTTVPEDVETETTLVSGEPVEALANVAGAPGTLLVLGSRGYGPLRRVLLGSVSARLVRLAPCPLIVTPRGAQAAREAAPPAEVTAAS